MGRVLITGVNGAIGSFLAAYLLDRGFDVYGSLRRPYAGLTLPIERNKTIVIDLGEDKPYRLPEELDAVVHCAAATSETTTDPELSRRVNVDGTARLIEASIKAKAKRFIFFSTMSANPRNPSNYARTKLEAESVVRAAKALDHVILRPGLVISSSSRGIFNKMAAYVRVLPLIPIIGNNDKLATISIADLSCAVEASIVTQEAAGLAIDVCADESLSLKRIVRVIAEYNRKKVLCVVIPYWLALFAAQAAAAVKLPILTKDNVYGLKYARAADPALLQDVLGITAEKFETVMAGQRGERR